MPKIEKSVTLLPAQAKRNAPSLHSPRPPFHTIYDELSRMASETKIFAGTGAPTGSFTLQYSYHLSGGIKSIKDPNSTNGWEVTYTSDKVGRVTAVGAPSGFPVQQFATGIAYRAFGGVKSMTYPTTQATSISLTYDDRLRPATYEAESAANTSDIHSKSYSYNNDGSIKQATNTLEANYTQTYQYDFAARLKKNEMGGTSGPYKQELGYDAFNNLTSRSTTHDGTSRSFTAGYTNNRITSGGFGTSPSNDHDAAGNVTSNIASSDDYRSWTFDAAGRVSNWGETTVYAGTTRWDQGEEITFDGDGRVAKRIKRKKQWTSPPSEVQYQPMHHLYSSVLGKEVAELGSSGSQWLKKIYFNGTVIAEQTPYTWGLVFKHTDPVTGSEMQTETSGETVPPELGRTELAALSEVIPTTPPEVQPPPHDFRKGGSLSNPQVCFWNYAPTSCRTVKSMIGSLVGRFESEHLIATTVQETWLEQFKVTWIPTDTERGFAITDVARSWVLTDVQVLSMEIIQIPGTGSLGGDDYTPPDPEAKKILSESITKGKKLLAEVDCASYLKRTFNLSDEEIGKIMSGVESTPTKFTGTGPIKGDFIVQAQVTTLENGTNELRIHNSFFTRPKPAISGGGGRTSMNVAGEATERTDPTYRGQLLIHEGIHIVNNSKYTDVYLANLIVNNDPDVKGTPAFGEKDINRASAFIQGRIRKHCN